MTTKKTVLQKVQKILTGRWMMGHELQKALRLVDVWISESSATARARDLRKVYGKTAVECRPIRINDKTLWEYRFWPTRKVK